MPDYARNAATAKSKLTEFGKAATVQAPAPDGGSWDSGGVRPDPVEVSFLETGYSITHRQESAIQAGDLVGLIDDRATVTAGWSITIDGTVFEIIDAQRVAPGPILIMTEIIARR